MCIWTDNSCSWKRGDAWTSLFSTDDKETLWDSNYPHVTNVKHNPVRWSKSQLSQRGNTSDRQIGALKQNQLHIYSSTTVNTQTIFKIENNVTQLFPWGGSTRSLAPAHTSGSNPCAWWQGQEGWQGRESALHRLTAGISLPCGSQSLHKDLNMAFNHSKVTALSLAHVWRATTLTVCSLWDVPTQSPPKPYFLNTLWDWATSVKLWACLHVTACKKLFSGHGADLVLSQVMTHLTSARTGVYYINASKKGRNSSLCSTNNGEKHVGESAHPSNKRDGRPCEIRAVSHLATYSLLTGVRGAAMQRRLN